MRQIFTSPRLENVEMVAALLKDAGIETWISEARSYKGNRRGTFSYKDAQRGGSQPAVWIVKADDLTAARSIMRDAGLLATTRPGSAQQVLPPSPHGVVDPNRTAKRMRRLILLFGVAAAAGFSLIRSCSTAPPEDRSHIVPVYTSPP
jgi:hypothetical protein